MVKKRSIPSPTRVPQVERTPRVIVRPGFISSFVAAIGDEPFLGIMAPSALTIDKGIIFVNGDVLDLKLDVFIEPLEGPVTNIEGIELKIGKNDIFDSSKGRAFGLDLEEGTRVSLILNQDAGIWYAFTYRII